MNILRRHWLDVGRADKYSLYPLGDVHLGAAACDEKAFRAVVNRIATDDRAYWVGLGDYCLSSDTEILTDQGWRSFDTLTPDDWAICYDLKSGRSFPEPILKKWYNEGDGQLVHITSGHVDILATRNHRLLVNHNVGNEWGAAEVVQASDLLNGKTKHIWRVPVAAQSWVGFDGRLDPDWFSLKGWIDTEGSLEKVGNYERLQLAQSITANADYVAEIDALLLRLNLSPHRARRRWGVVVWRFNGEETRKIHGQIGRKGERIAHMMNAPAECLEAYFNALMNGDGTWSRQCFAQKDKALVDVFQELCFKLGYRAKVTQRPYDLAWQCHFGRGRGFHSLIRDVAPIEYEGYTWCISTKPGLIVIRRNNKICVVGNCDFINVSDPRFAAGSLAPWIKMADLGDLARAQCDRFLEIVEPIAPRCLGLIEGNHELSIKRYYERDIYSDIVCGVKELGGFAADHSLALGYYGWLLLSFYRAPEKRRETLYKINLHHGFTGGRLAGAKALNMQRWLWTHDADLVIFGHSHNTGAQAEAVETITRGGHVSHITRRGCYGGTFLATNAEGGSTYSEVKGYFPLPVTQPMISLRPGAADKMDRLRVVT